MPDDDGEPTVSEALAAARSETDYAELLAELSSPRSPSLRRLVVDYGTVESWMRLTLSLASVVFGLTISFVTPDLATISRAELWLLSAALILLCGSIVVGLSVVLDAVAKASQMQSQSNEELQLRDIVGRVRKMRARTYLAFGSVLLFLLGIGTLAGFALLRLPSAR